VSGLAIFQRSRIEISLADLVRAFAPSANAIDGLGFAATITEHKRAVVDVLDWLAEHGALRLSDGSAENWAHDSERGDALYDVDHDICASLFRPGRPIQHLPGAGGLLDISDVGARRPAQRAAAARRARRLLLEHPVLYYALLYAETAAALRETELADNLARLTGLVVERRAEGVMLADPTGRFTDQPFPGRGGAVNRTAGLLLAKIADLVEKALGTAQQLLAKREQACRDADARLQSARAAIAQELRAWTDRWSGAEPYAVVTAGQVDVLAASWTGSASRTHRP